MKEEIFLASDHAGFELKEKIKEFLLSKNYNILDCGPEAYNADDDYPDYISQVAKRISKTPETRGIIFGMSGEGEAMVANRFPHVRAAVYYGGPDEILTLSREHNNANVLSLSAKFLTPEQAISAVTLWLNTPFSGEERHMRRIKKIEEAE